LPSEIALTPFDHYMLADESHECPMVFYFRATLDGVCDKKKFLDALKNALTRHRQLSSTIIGTPNQRTKKLKFRHQPKSTPWIDWGNVGAPFEYPDNYHGIDLGVEIGLRVFVRVDSQKTYITLQIHHAAADATGAWQLLEDILVYYSGDPLLLRAIDETKLPSRGTWHQSRSAMRKRIFKDLNRTLLFFKNRPKPILSKTKTVLESEAQPSYKSIELDRSELLLLKKHAKSEGVTINDLLLCNLFQSLHKWNNLLGKRKCIRIAMPTNMRFPEDQDIPATNIVSMAFIDRSGEILSDNKLLLKSIANETRYIKSNLIGITLCRVSKLFGKLPNGLNFLLKPKPGFRCGTSVVLSNLADPTTLSQLSRTDQKIHSGNLVLLKLELLSPIRDFTHCAIGIVTYQGKMTVSINYDSKNLTAVDAQEILDIFVKNVLNQTSCSQ